MEEEVQLPQVLKVHFSSFVLLVEGSDLGVRQVLQVASNFGIAEETVRLPATGGSGVQHLPSLEVDVVVGVGSPVGSDVQVHQLRVIITTHPPINTPTPIPPTATHN